MIKYRLKEDFAGEPKGKIFEFSDIMAVQTLASKCWIYKGAKIELSTDSPLLERVREKPKHKVGDVVIHNCELNQPQRKGQIAVVTEETESGHPRWTKVIFADGFTEKYNAEHLLPAPPLPKTPIEYEGVKYKVEEKNGVPVISTGRKGETPGIKYYCTYCNGVHDFIAGCCEQICYILTPIEFTLDKKFEPATGTNFTLIEAAIRELQAKVKEGK